MGASRRLWLCGSLVLTLAVVFAAPAYAGTSGVPWWHVSSGARPSYLPLEGDGEVVVTVANVGDATASGEEEPVTIMDQLPVHLKATSVTGIAGGLSRENRGAVKCTTVGLRCEFSGTLPPFDQIEMRIKVQVEPGAEPTETNNASVSGAEAASVSSEGTLHTSSGETPFGVEHYEMVPEEVGGGVDTRAGSHPFQFTTQVTINQDAASTTGYLVNPAGLPKDLSFMLPAGFVGNVTQFKQCTDAQFLTEVEGDQGNECPVQSVVGVATVTYDLSSGDEIGTETRTLPVFNLEPHYGEPARFGFLIEGLFPIVLDTSVRSGSDYGITVKVDNIPQTGAVLNTLISFWGAPGDPRHNDARGSQCIRKARGIPIEYLPCVESEETSPPALLSLPTSCGAPLPVLGEADSWAEQHPEGQGLRFAGASMPALDGCNRLPFTPTMKAAPTTNSASSPSGLGFELGFHDEGLLNAEGMVQSQLKDTSVILPEGFTIDPSAGVGLAGCTPEDYARETIESAPGAGCPNESKLGTVEIETPLLTQKIDGNIFIAQPYENPFNSLVGLYVVAKNPETGVLIKLAGKVTPNLVTGQLVTTFENNPQLPFDHFVFHFREGAQAPLITPATCGVYTTKALLAPWSEPLNALVDESSFTITTGSGDGACPSGGAPPFSPQITAGTVNNNAGAFSPLYVDLSRTDAEQEISGFSTELPPGLTGDLTGIPFCPEADIEAARHETGAQEEASPPCPSASQIGHTEVGTGVGAVLAYVPGEVYLAGPFNGHGACTPGESGCAPFSLVSVTSAKVGPFDLGTVVIRFGLNIDPRTARVSVTPSSSEPIPTIIDGIVTHVRDIKVYVDRPDFIVNPTSCEPKQLSSTLNSNNNTTATTASPFQTVNCGNLKFEPKFTASASGKTSKADGTSLTVKISNPPGSLGTQADVSKVKVELPIQLPSRLTTLQKACTQAQFQTNPAGCPPASIVGHAKVSTPIIPVPLEGPAYFVSNGGEAFPNLIMVLQGYGIKIELVGDTFISKRGITSSTFNAVPDQPFSSFEVTLPAGPHSALTGLGNLCTPTTITTVKKKVKVKTKHGGHKTVTRKVKQTKPTSLLMPTEMIGQNGAAIHTTTHVAVTECPKAKSAVKHKKKSQEKRKKGKAGKKGAR